MSGSVVQWLSPSLRPGNAAPAQRFQVDGAWRQRSYGDLHRLVLETAAALREHGVSRGGRIAILARTRADWSVVDLAAAAIGAPLVPIYPTSAPSQVAEILRRSRPSVLVTERGARLPEPIEVTVLLLGAADGDLGDLAHAPLAPEQATAIEAGIADVAADDLYSISFSSGSTGEPKGCLLTHANYTSVLDMASRVELGAGAVAPAHRELAFVFLPLAHASARLQQLTTFTLGGELAYGTGGTAQILEQIGEIEPTYVPGVPRLFESAYVRAGRDPERLRRMFGGRVQYTLTGGAPIDPEMLATYQAAGLPLVEGYGLTETATALTLCAPHSNRPGSVGKALPGVELAIAEDGEILAKGPNVFVGYLDDPESTAAAMTEGWFRTGDLGRFDPDGFLYVTGRKKHLLVTSTGKNVAPEPTENRLRRLTGLDGVLLVGDRRPYLIALVFTAGDAADAAGLRAAANAVNSELSPPEHVRKIVATRAELSVEFGEVTPSGKLVRHSVVERMRSVIDDVYEGRTSPDVVVIDVEGRFALRGAS